MKSPLRTWTVLAIAGLMGAGALRADTLHLKNGRVLRNVRAVPTGDTHTVVFANGRVRSIPNARIARVSIAPVRWRRASAKPAPEEIRRAVQEGVARELERLRKAGHLPEPGHKQRQPVQPEAPASEKAVSPGPQLDDAIWRSVVLPGWGQYYMERRWAAAGYLVAFLAAVDHYRDTNAAYKQQKKDNETPFLGGPSALSLAGLFFFLESRKQAENRLFREREESLRILGGVWLLNVIDLVAVPALFGASPRGREAAVRYSFGVRSDQIFVGVSVAW